MFWLAHTYAVPVDGARYVELASKLRHVTPLTVKLLGEVPQAAYSATVSGEPVAQGGFAVRRLLVCEVGLRHVTPSTVKVLGERRRRQRASP
jgi:hypothetical protein